MLESLPFLKEIFGELSFSNLLVKNVRHSVTSNVITLEINSRCHSLIVLEWEESCLTAGRPLSGEFECWLSFKQSQCYQFGLKSGGLCCLHVDVCMTLQVPSPTGWSFVQQRVWNPKKGSWSYRAVWSFWCRDTVTSPFVLQQFACWWSLYEACHLSFSWTLSKLSSLFPSLSLCARCWRIPVFPQSGLWAPSYPTNTEMQEYLQSALSISTRVHVL